VSQPLVYVDASEVRAGALEELKAAIRELAEFVNESEPQLVSYDVHFSGDGTQMTVIHVHTDPASLDHHMDVAGPRFGRFADLVTLRSIHVYGEPSERRSPGCATRCACLRQLSRSRAISARPRTR
jgi:quinol monooxygenase YgiN